MCCFSFIKISQWGLWHMSPPLIPPKGEADNPLYQRPGGVLPLTLPVSSQTDFFPSQSTIKKSRTLFRFMSQADRVLVRTKHVRRRKSSNRYTALAGLPLYLNRVKLIGLSKFIQNHLTYDCKSAFWQRMQQLL